MCGIWNESNEPLETHEPHYTTSLFFLVLLKTIFYSNQTVELVTNCFNEFMSFRVEVTNAQEMHNMFTFEIVYITILESMKWKPLFSTRQQQEHHKHSLDTWKNRKYQWLKEFRRERIVCWCRKCNRVFTLQNWYSIKWQ